MYKVVNYLVASVFVVMVPVAAYTETPSSVFEINDSGRAAFCGQIGASWLPALKRRNGTFVSARSELRSLVAKIRREKSRKIIARLESTQRSVRVLQSRTRATCAEGPPQSIPDGGTGGTLPPTPTPTPTPQGSVPPINPCFLPGGDIKAGCFGIPATLIANINRGETFYGRNCRGCHGVRVAMPYDRVATSFDRIPQMQPFKPGAQQLADIVAYLNRFNF
jgi:hypothetical protein